MEYNCRYIILQLTLLTLIMVDSQDNCHKFNLRFKPQNNIFMWWCVHTRNNNNNLFSIKSMLVVFFIFIGIVFCAYLHILFGNRKERKKKQEKKKKRRDRPTEEKLHELFAEWIRFVYAPQTVYYWSHPHRHRHPVAILKRHGSPYTIYGNIQYRKLFI